MIRRFTQEELDHYSDEIRFRGGRLAEVADLAKTTPDQLARLIGLPRLRAIPDESEPDIFATERLHAVL